ncbi:MAG: malate dehydrogenase [Methanomicrobiales archaeon]|jgi:malate dehydrogenase|nr:malate dehydrogenase [Methanomicrobiales archaeon]
MYKVSIIGASGTVGRYAALAISRIPNVREIVLFGRSSSQAMLESIARDLLDSFAATGIPTKVSWSSAAESLADSKIVIITAGVPRKQGQDRLDLAYQNAEIVAQYAKEIVCVAPKALIMVVSNPVDVMTSVALASSGKDPHHVFGLGTHLDSMRLKSLIADHYQVHVSEVHTRIIGEHGESMVPLWSATTIGGIQLSHFYEFEAPNLPFLLETVKKTGQMIIEGRGATEWGPGEAIATIVRVILGNENRILTLSAYVSREINGMGGVCIGIPVLIHKQGVHPVAIHIEEDEANAFRDSIARVKAVTEEIMMLLKEKEVL